MLVDAVWVSRPSNYRLCSTNYKNIWVLPVDLISQIGDSCALSMIDSIVNILEAVSLTPTDGVMIFVCTGLMFLLYKTLEAKVFAPLLEHVEQRESLTSGAVFTAMQMRQKTAALKARFDESIFKARVEGGARRAEIVSAAKEKAQAIVREAEAQAASELSAGRQEIAKQVAGAQTKADGEAQELAKTLANQVDSQLSHANQATFNSTLVALFLIAGILFAAPVGAFASSGHGEPSIGDLTFYWINFALYIGLMTYILRKPISKGWAARVSRIKQTVAQSGDDVDAAERELNAIEALIKALPLEQDKIKKQLVEQANAEADDIIRQAQQRATRIKDQARELLKGETRSAQVSFKQRLIEKALTLAKERFASGEFATRDAAYQAAAVTRAKSLIQQ